MSRFPILSNLLNSKNTNFLPRRNERYSPSNLLNNPSNSLQNQTAISRISNEQQNSGFLGANIPHSAEVAETAGKLRYI